MRPESYKLFAQLCESYLPEASTAMQAIADHPGGRDLIKYLHREKELPHNVNFREIPKVRWSDFKGAYYGAWVIIQADKGVGAIKSDRDGFYLAHVVDPETGSVKTKESQRGGNILDFLKGHIGKFRKFYTGNVTQKMYGKRAERAGRAYSRNEGRTITLEELVQKFRPLWVKAVNAAIADIKGMAVNMIKNDAFEKAKKKLNKIDFLEQALEEIDQGGVTPIAIQSSVRLAMLMTASHYYPEQTGEITRARWGIAKYEAENYRGSNQVLDDISKGDMKKLSTVLAFFKQGLISG